MKRLIAVLAAGLALTGCASQPAQKPAKQPTDFERYDWRCGQKGGHVVPQAIHWQAVDYRCLGPDFTDVLPPFTDVG